MTTTRPALWPTVISPPSLRRIGLTRHPVGGQCLPDRPGRLATAVQLVSRRLGPGRLWNGALVAFTVTSCLCALAPDVGWLIVFRVLQGLAAGVLLPAGQAILGQVAGPQRMGRVMGVVGIAVVGAPTIGPTVGGLMLDHLSWPWLFLINLPLGVVALVLGLRTLPMDRGTPQGALHVGGLVTATVGVSAVVYGLSELGSRGSAGAVEVWLPVLVGLIALAGFVAFSSSNEHPLLDLAVFSNRVFAAATVASFFAGAAMFGAMFILPLYFQITHGDGLLRTGLLLAAYGAGGAVALPVGGRLTDQYGGGAVAVLGNLASALTILPMALLAGDPSPWLIEPLLFAYGIATACSGMPLVSAAYAAVRHDQIPDAAALINILQRVGGAVGVAGLAVVLARAAEPASGFRIGFAVVCAASVASAAAAEFLRRHQRSES